MFKMFKTFNCPFDCKPAELHLERKKNPKNQNKQTKKTPKKPIKPQVTNKKKIKTPHQKAPFETKPRNLVFTVLKAYSVAVWDGPKYFPAGRVYLFILLRNSAYGDFCFWAETNEIVTGLPYDRFLSKTSRPRFMESLYTYIF